MGGLPFTEAGIFSCARRLVSGYNGAAITVRRANDNAERDIGLVGALSQIGYLDIKSIIDHCGANNGFVSKVWRQAGSGNCSNATTSQQPKIYDGTTGMNIRNGLPVMTFDGSDDRLSWTPGFSTSTSPAFTLGTVCKYASVAAFSVNVKIGGNSSSGNVFDYAFANTTQVDLTCSGTNRRSFTIANATTKMCEYVVRHALNANMTATELRQDFADATQSAASSATLSLSANTALWGGTQNSGGTFTQPSSMDANCMLLMAAELSNEERKIFELCLAQHMAA